MNRSIVSIVTATIFLALSAHPAQAARVPDSPYYHLEPTAAPAPVIWQGVNSPLPEGDHYARNIFWNFNDSTLPSHYFGVLDNTLKSRDTYTGNAMRPPGRLGLIGQGDRYATFGIADLDLGAGNTSPKYFWLEMDATLHKAGSTISVTLSGAGASLTDSWANQGATRTGDTWTWAFGNNGTETRTVNAWFAFDSFPSAESLRIAFHGSSPGSSAVIDNLHVSTTPEPVSSALFVTGAGLLALRRRRISSGIEQRLS